MTLPNGVSASEVQYPAAEKTRLAFSSEELSVFTGDVQFRVPLKSDAGVSATDSLTVTLDYQACNNNQCLAPTSISNVVGVSNVYEVGASTPVAVAAESTVPQSSDWLSRTFSRRGNAIGFLLVLLGGLALNLTPCVYPLIGVTIAYFGNQGGGPRRVLSLAILFVLGIAIMFSSVGVAVALSGGLFGAAMQNPFVLSAVAAMMLVLAASSFGFFVIQPPQFMAQWAGAARPGYAGSFLMGLGMGVVAAPCIGPIVLGLLLMVERSGNPLFGFALFFTLAVGLGLPYVGLAMAAGSIRRLPRSGEWLAWVEQLFGFILVGLAIYFLDPVHSESPDVAHPSLLCGGGGNFPRLLFAGGAQLAAVPGASQRPRNHRGRRAHLHDDPARESEAGGFSALRSGPARRCRREAQAGAGRFRAPTGASRAARWIILPSSIPRW